MGAGFVWFSWKGILRITHVGSTFVETHRAFKNTRHNPLNYCSTNAILLFTLSPDIRKFNRDPQDIALQYLYDPKCCAYERQRKRGVARDGLLVNLAWITKQRRNTEIAKCTKFLQNYINVIPTLHHWERNLFGADIQMVRRAINTYFNCVMISAYLEKTPRICRDNQWWTQQHSTARRAWTGRETNRMSETPIELDWSFEVRLSITH